MPPKPAAAAGGAGANSSSAAAAAVASQVAKRTRQQLNPQVRAPRGAGDIKTRRVRRLSTVAKRIKTMQRVVCLSNMT